MKNIYEKKDVKLFNIFSKELKKILLKKFELTSFSAPIPNPQSPYKTQKPILLIYLKFYSRNK